MRCQNPERNNNTPGDIKRVGSASTFRDNRGSTLQNNKSGNQNTNEKRIKRRCIDTRLNERRELRDNRRRGDKRVNRCEEMNCPYLVSFVGIEAGYTYQGQACELPEGAKCPLEHDDNDESYKRANDAMEKAIARCETDYEGEIK